MKLSKREEALILANRKRLNEKYTEFVNRCRTKHELLKGQVRYLEDTIYRGKRPVCDCDRDDNKCSGREDCPAALWDMLS